MMEGFRPGVVKRLGIDYDAVREANPRAVYASFSGYGQDGPYRDVPGHELNYAAISGLLGLTGRRDSPPAIPGALIADWSGGLSGAVAILAAIVARQRSGTGQFIDVAIADAVTEVTSVQVNPYLYKRGTVPQRGETIFSGMYPWYNVYETKDGKHVAIATLESKFFANLCRLLGCEHFIPHQFDEGQKRDEMFRFFADLFRTRTRDEWTSIADASGDLLYPGPWYRRNRAGSPADGPADDPGVGPPHCRPPEADRLDAQTQRLAGGGQELGYRFRAAHRRDPPRNRLHRQPHQPAARNGRGGVKAEATYRLIDSHAHLEELGDLDPAIDRAREAGVVAIVAVGSDYESNNRVLEIAARHEGFVYPALGLHPGVLDRVGPSLERDLQFIESHLGRAVAIGEVGLDYHKRVLGGAGKERQQAVFRTVLSLGRQHRKPVIIHSRYAWKDCLALTAESGVEAAVFHWFTGPASVLRGHTGGRVLRLGHHRRRVSCRAPPGHQAGPPGQAAPGNRLPGHVSGAAVRAGRRQALAAGGGGRYGAVLRTSWPATPPGTPPASSAWPPPDRHPRGGAVF